MKEAARKSVRLRHVGLEYAMALLCCVIVSGYVALTLWDINTDRRNTLAEGARTARMAAAAIAQHTVETFSEGSSPMASMEQLMAEAGGFARISRQQAHLWLKALTPPDTPVDRLMLFDMRGWIYATTVRPNPPKQRDYVRHPAVMAHLEGRAENRLVIDLPLELPPEAFLFETMTQPGSSRWIIPITRTLRTKKGEADAIMAALMRADYFNQFYSILGNYRDASIALLRDDGALLARHPFRPEYQGANFSNILASYPGGDGSPIITSPIDGIERLYAVQKAEGLPLNVVVGLSTESVLQPWTERTTQRLVACAIFSAVVVIFSLALIRDFRFRRSAERAVHRLNVELEERVRTRTSDLVRANQDLQDFSYSASHDLRAPIRRIGNFADAIVLDHGAVLPFEARRKLERIRLSAVHTNQLLNDLINLFKVNQSVLKPETLDIALMARGIVEQLAADDPARRYDLEIQKERMRVSADEGLLRLALTNLLSNAWKYSSKTPHTRIAVGRVGDEFFVRDNGAGFDMAHVQKLFMSFSRLHAETEFDGTGIGLAIVARVIERHGGRVRAEGKPGEGATFYFTLP